MGSTSSVAPCIRVIWLCKLFFLLRFCSFFAFASRLNSAFLVFRPMLFWACSDNLKASDNMSHRHYPFSLLKDGKHDYSKLKKAFPNSKCKVIVKQVLRNNFKPSQPDLSEAAREAALFNKLCDVFEHMYKRHASARSCTVHQAVSHTHQAVSHTTPQDSAQPVRPQDCS